MEVLIPQQQNHASRVPFRRFSKCRERGRKGFFIFSLWLIPLCLGINLSGGQTVSHEYPLKAVFLLNFAQFTYWPTNAFDTPESPLVIGVLGDDPFGPLLDDAVRDETVNGRTFVVKRYQRVKDIKTCHILFISQSETSRLDRILAELKRKPILTVSDIVNAAYQGVCVRFVTENNKIHLRINMDSLRDASLVISSQLLRASEIISAPAK